MIKRIVVDTGDVRDSASIHRAFQNALSFPDYYGANLDAFHDCITSDVELPVEVIWTGIEQSEFIDPGLTESIAGILNEYSDDEPQFRLTIQEQA